ncbi:MAG: MATE family efflux transporter [Dictyoglomaceae bacterium]|nr:MATE family efflux transporter [Dictyoglomaceae bacterium]
MKAWDIWNNGDINIRKRLKNLAIPVLIENIFQLLFSFVDMFFVGFLGNVALSSVGLGGQIVNIFVAILASLTTGTLVMVAHSVGAKRYKIAQDYIRNSLTLGIFLSIFLFFFGLFIVDPLLTLLGAKGSLASLTAIYLKYILIPGFLIVFIPIISAGLRGAGDTKTPLYVSMVANILNIFGDYVLVFGKFGFPAMGVAGAALATSLSRFIALIYLFIILYRKNSLFNIQLRKMLGFEKEKMFQILRIGVPTSLEQLFFSIGALLYATIVLQLGTKAYAAHRIALNIESLSFQPGFAFAVAATTLVGQFRGAKEDENAFKASIESWKIAIIFMGIIGVILFLFPVYLVKIFSREKDVINMAVLALKIIAFIQPLLATNMVMAGSLRGSGMSKLPMISNGLGMWVIRIPFTYFFINIMKIGFPGAWIAMAMDITFKALINFYFFVIKRSWKNLTVRVSSQEV